MLTVVSLLNAKGGVGKSTCTLILSQMAAHLGIETRVVDADRRGALVNWDAMAERKGYRVPRLSVVEAPDYDSFVRVYDEAEFDGLMFIDLPGEQTALGAAAVEKSDLIITPGRYAPLDVGGVIEANEFVDAVATDSGFEKPPVFWLMTMFDPIAMKRTKFATAEGRREFADRYGLHVFTHALIKREAYHQLPMGNTFWSLKQTPAVEKATVEARNVATELLDHLGDDDAKEASR